MGAAYHLGGPTQETPDWRVFKEQLVGTAECEPTDCLSKVPCWESGPVGAASPAERLG